MSVGLLRALQVEVASTSSWNTLRRCRDGPTAALLPEYTGEHKLKKLIHVYLGSVSPILVKPNIQQYRSEC